MRKLRPVLVVVLVWSITAAHFASAQTRKQWQNAPDIERRIETLLKQMSLAEKVGQLNQYSYGQPTGPETGRSTVEESTNTEKSVHSST